MRKLAVMAVLATSALTSPALAKDGAWYVGVEGGGLIVQDTSINIGAIAGIDRVSHPVGFDVGGIVGYDIGPVRLEGEVAYKYAKLKAHTTTATIGGVPSGYYRGRAGRDEVLTFMGNALFDFGDENGISGYVGGGVGVARVSYKGYRLNGGNVFLDGSDTRFAFQGIAGVRYAISSHVDLGAKYRFLNVYGVRIDSKRITNAQATI